MYSIPPALHSLGRFIGLAGVALLACAAHSASAAEPDADKGWTIMGHQGMVRMVLVPPDKATDLQSYEQQIALICGDATNCFLNFYTNSTGAAIELPLPDAISHEATAIYRKSYKKGVPLLTWSCRMGVPGADECF